MKEQEAEGEVANHLHWKYELNVHFPTAAINHCDFLHATEQGNGVCLLPTSPGNGNARLFHCLEMLITQNIYCFRDTRSSEAEFFSFLLSGLQKCLQMSCRPGESLCSGKDAVAQESPEAAEQMLYCRTLADTLCSPSNQLL